MSNPSLFPFARPASAPRRENPFRLEAVRCLGDSEAVLHDPGLSPAMIVEHLAAVVEELTEVAGKLAKEVVEPYTADDLAALRELMKAARRAHDVCRGVRLRLGESPAVRS
jgi:hypothetical protein